MQPNRRKMPRGMNTFARHCRGGIQKIALFGKIPSLYYGKNSSNKQRETTVHHYFKT